jgi:hypothetical protein
MRVNERRDDVKRSIMVPDRRSPDAAGELCPRTGLATGVVELLGTVDDIAWMPVWIP